MIEQFRSQHLTTFADGRQLVRAVFELEADTSSIHILPAGPLVATRDERAFVVRDLAMVAARSELPILLDWEHRSEWGGETRAAGWLTSLDVRSSGLWGRVDWTPAGRADVDSRSYRYLSPVLILDGETREVRSVVSVALTNRPALKMAEIGAQAFSAYARSKGHSMTNNKLQPAARAALHRAGLSDRDISDAQAYRAQRLAETGTVNDRSVDKELLSRGLTPAEIAAARAYNDQRRAEVMR